ncbi:MAG TPA: TetR family transcriptional regulator [Bacteroidales bacterium]|nr:TetR family transcriptional regulator [Bacteroidales bacterium]
METKERIIQSATGLFLEKGYERTSVREIAKRADINLALMNYYFRSKEILFENIVNLLIGKTSGALKKILDSDLILEEKIWQYICNYIDMLIQNPLLVSFILAVLNRNPDQLTRLSVTDNLYNSEVFKKQLTMAFDEGKIKKTNPEQFYINMLSMIAFPFAIKKIIMQRNNFTEKQFDVFIESRKEIIYNTLMSELKL